MTLKKSSCLLLFYKIKVLILLIKNNLQKINRVNKYDLTYLFFALVITTVLDGPLLVLTKQFVKLLEKLSNKSTGEK